MDLSGRTMLVPGWKQNKAIISYTDMLWNNHCRKDVPTIIQRPARRGELILAHESALARCEMRMEYHQMGTDLRCPCQTDVTCNDGLWHKQMMPER